MSLLTKKIRLLTFPKGFPVFDRILVIFSLFLLSPFVVGSILWAIFRRNPAGDILGGTFIQGLQGFVYAGAYLAAVIFFPLSAIAATLRSLEILIDSLRARRITNKVIYYYVCYCGLVVAFYSLINKSGRLQ